MEAGVVTQDNLTSLLRNISQRRRQGVLEITYPGRVVRVIFMQGKVVECEHDDALPAMELLERLQAGGYIEQSLSWTPGEDRSAHYRSLFEALTSRGLPQPVFLRALKHRILDSVYGLDTSSGAYYNFKVQMVECDRELAPHISVGQVLLDMVALETDAHRFEETFGSGRPLRVQRDSSGALSDEEQVLISLIEESVPFENLKTRSLLSSYHFQDALLSLYERGIIAFGSAADSFSSEGSSSESGGSLMDSIEGALDDILGTELASAQREMRETVAGQGTPVANAEEVVNPQVMGTAQQAAGTALDRLASMNRACMNSESTVGVIGILFFFAVVVVPILWWENLITAFF